MKQYFIMKETRNGTIYEALTNTKEEAFEKLWDIVRGYIPDFLNNEIILNRISFSTENSFECHINIDIMAHTEDNAIGGIFDVIVDVCGERFTWYIDEIEYLKPIDHPIMSRRHINERNV